MSEYTLRPNVLVSNDFTAVGGAALAVVSDGSDATYVADGAANTLRMELAVPAPALPSDEFIDRVFPRTRTSKLVADNTTGSHAISYNGATATTALVLANDNLGTIVEQDGTGLANVWAAGMIPGVRLTLAATSKSMRFHDTMLMAQTQKLASALPTGGTEAASAYPVIPVTVTADIDDWQLLGAAVGALTMRVELQVTDGGGATVWTSHRLVTFSEVVGTGRTLATTITAPVGMPDGGYSLRARVGRQRTAYPGEWIYGAWSASVALTMATAPPVAPALVATAVSADSSVRLDVTPGSQYDGGPSVFTDAKLTVERNEGGDTWTVVRGADAAPGVFSFANTFYDHELPRGVAVQYRAKVEATRDGHHKTGAWSTVATATVPVEGWHLKCPEVSAYNVIDALVTDAPDTMNADRGVFRPVGRAHAIVAAGTMNGYDGSLTVVTKNDAEAEAMDTLLRAGKVLLLQSCHGWQRYIRQASEVSRVSVGSGPAYLWSFDYVQTAAP